MLYKSNTSQAHVRLDVLDKKEGVNVRGRDLPNDILISKEYKYQTASFCYIYLDQDFLICIYSCVYLLFNLFTNSKICF